MIVFKELGRYGRFANGLFQIASTIGIATKSGQPFGFPKFINWDHKDRFGSTEDCEVYKHFKNELPEMIDVPYRDHFVHWGYHNVYFPDGNWNLLGHMQSEKYFSHCMDTVRHYLRFKDEYPQSEYVAIHYRAGDYIDDPNAYHPRCTKEYYEEAMRLFPGEQFMVFTDDYNRAAEMFGAKVQYAKGKDYIDDFKLMKACKSFIIANSSYSLMAAILGEHSEKKTVCPKKWFGDVAGLDWQDCYPKNSIVI